MSINSASNQHTPDDREQKCWDLYVKSIAKGTPNAKASALKAGYSEPHADNITLQGWFKGRVDKLRRTEMLSKAERNLDKALDESYKDEDGKIQSDVMRIVVDVSKTIATTLGKDEGYSSRSEITGKNGEAIELSETKRGFINQALNGFK
jgi:phage terminase small subunit